MLGRYSEQQLVEGLKKKDMEIYEECIRIYKNYVGAVIIRKSNNTLSMEDVEELIADVFFSMWKNARHIDTACGNLRTYIAAIARNKTVDAMKRNRTKAASYAEITDEIISENSENDSKVHENNPEMYAIRQENKSDLLDKLMELGKPDCNIVYAYYYEQKSVKDISVSTGLSEANVKQRLYRSRNKLKSIIQEGDMII